MAHPSSIVRGKVLTVPARDLPSDSAGVELALADAVRAVEPSSQVLVTISEGDRTELRVLIVSGSMERSLRRWQAMVSPILRAHGVHADWPKALVLHAAAIQPRHD